MQYLEGFYGEDVASTANLQRIDRDLYFVEPPPCPNLSWHLDTVANIAVLFDGFIYNKADFGFADDVPNCDVVAELFKKHGICFVLSYLDGAFAFALADMQTFTDEPASLYLCRDVGGSKPLYYGGGCFRTTVFGGDAATEVRPGSYTTLRLKFCVQAKWEVKSPQVFYYLPCLPLTTRFDKPTLRYMFRKVVRAAVEKIAAVIHKPVFLIQTEREAFPDQFRIIKRHFVENLDIELSQGPDTVAFVSAARKPYVGCRKEIYYPLLDRDVVQMFCLFPHFVDTLLDRMQEVSLEWAAQIKSAK